MKTKIKLLTPKLPRQMDAYRRAANYLPVGQIYLYDNPLLKQPLKLSHVKPLVVGHWGTTPGQNFVYGFTRVAGRLSGPTASGRNRHL
jgi:xylulose-5-phosphate/fructose-6-phosphate phosphoketolase